MTSECVLWEEQFMHPVRVAYERRNRDLDPQFKRKRRAYKPRQTGLTGETG